MPPTNRRPRTVNTSRHFCPHAGCRYRGWVGLGNLRANGHPSGGPWRQCQCTSCEGYFPELHGTIFHGKQGAVELIVCVLACVAEGLGIRATARVFEGDPHTVLRWLVEAAEQLRAFSCSFLCEVHVQQIQFDELYAVRSAVKDGEMRAAGGAAEKWLCISYTCVYNDDRPSMEPLMGRIGADTMGAVTQRSPLSRRTFLRVVGTASGAALGSGLLGSCGSGPTASGEQVVNLLWSDVTNVRAPLIEDFTNATGIKVNQTIVQYNQRLQKIHTAVQGGGDFDVVQMDTVWTARFAAAGWVDDLTSRITEAIKQDVPAAALGAVTYNGKLYGMPLFNSAKHLFYNAKLLKEAGFDHPPATMDEFVAQAKGTTRQGQWGSLWSWKQSEALICDWISIMFTQPDAQLLNSHGKAVFNTMGGTEALQGMVDLLYQHQVADPASLESTEDDVRKMLQTGTYALTYNWEGVLPEANDPRTSKAAPNIRVALLPGGRGVKSSSMNGSEGWAILAQSRRHEAAWALLEYMASPAWQKKAALIAGDYPILASLYSDADLQENVQDLAIYGEQFKYLVVRPQLTDYARKSDIIQRHLHTALLRKVSPKEAMHAAASEVNRATATP